MPQATCIRCAMQFEQTNGNRKYCTQYCREQAKYGRLKANPTA